MSAPVEQIGNPSYEESVLMALDEAEYDPAAQWAVDSLAAGKSPGILSIVRADLIGGLAFHLHEALHTHEPGEANPHHPKTRVYNRLITAAEAGDPEAISTLPKVATTAGQLATTVELTLDNLDDVREWRQGHRYVQFIGSFNPQHVGHRSTIRDTLTAAGEGVNGLVQVVQNHPIKKDSLPPYIGRFRQGEQKLYSSTLLNPSEVTMLDVPLGLGLAKRGAEQIRLIASVTGDEKMRWLVGSDKFMTDVNNVRAGEQLDKAGARFSGVHLYVARRDTQTTEEITEGADYVRGRFGADVTIVPETTDPLIIQAAASKIRAMRAEGRHAEADEMEYSDLPDLRPRR
ncbi:MAG TPA: hypothetical protein VFT16_02500 [Candidatus Saccharimonadales bacterium]|nr:hypothetical protein [Candidatus Saccharimonadales bacterium]